MISDIAEIKNNIVTEVPAGSTATLRCISNDYNHNFMFWLFDEGKVIGPGNDYDKNKYKYEVLSGNLMIHVSRIFVSHYFFINNFVERQY